MVINIIPKMVELGISMEELVSLEEYAFLNPTDRSELENSEKLARISSEPLRFLQSDGPQTTSGDRIFKILAMLNEDIKPVAKPFMNCIERAKEHPALKQFMPKIKGLHQALQTF
eukprot:m.6119 g.6119  ORF g.6119 m.6119 type:complete len:115 (+) comp14980_c0_seq1:1108-1452(+)